MTSSDRHTLPLELCAVLRWGPRGLQFAQLAGLDAFELLELGRMLLTETVALDKVLSAFLLAVLLNLRNLC